jgi:uncharacterized protein YndB with AHSA1/START domain
MITVGTARAVADLGRGLALATVEVAADPERAYIALASDDVLRWWVRPGVFDTREWSGEVRAGGAWRASGVGGGQPYVLHGKFLEVEPPRRLVHTWALGDGAPSTVEYEVEAVDGGTRITLHHTGLTPRQTCAATAIGWETSFEELARMLAQA